MNLNWFGPPVYIIIYTNCLVPYVLSVCMEETNLREGLVEGHARVVVPRVVRRDCPQARLPKGVGSDSDT